MIKFIIALLIATACANPLDDYVNKPDSSYHWELANTVQHEGYTFYVLKLTSQTWLSEAIIDKPVWQHWVRIMIPTNGVTNRNAMIYINGGGNPLGNPPSNLEDYLVRVGLETNAVMVELNQIPNQPIQFFDEDFSRSEDSFLAKTWDRFIRSRNAEDLGRLPMVKAVVKAMDAVSEFVETLPAEQVTPPETYVLAGGSKRGWTTWLAGAVDERVSAIAPIVIDILDMTPNINEIYQTYGRFPVALKDYTEMNITRCLNCPAFEELGYIEDPMYYLDRFQTRNVPIFALNAIGDEFFVPASWKWWFQQYGGEAHIRYLPNAEHSMATAIPRLQDTLIAFYQTLENDRPRPKYEWSVSEDGTTITLKTEETPTRVELVQAENRFFDRKFIVNCYLTCLFRGSPLTDMGNNTYVGHLDMPTDGSFKAFMLEFSFDVGSTEELTFSTGVSIIPDKFMHEPCPASECGACETCRADDGSP